VMVALLLRASALPVHAHGVLVLSIANFQIAAVRAFQRMRNAAWRMHVGGCDHECLALLVDAHDPVYRMLATLGVGLVAHQMQQLVTVRLEELALQGHGPGRVIIASSLARRTQTLMR